MEDYNIDILKKSIYVRTAIWPSVANNSRMVSQDMQNIISVLAPQGRQYGFVYDDGSVHADPEHDFYLPVFLTRTYKIDGYVDTQTDEKTYTIQRQEINPYFIEMGFFNSVSRVRINDGIHLTPKMIQKIRDNYASQSTIETNAVTTLSSPHEPAPTDERIIQFSESSATAEHEITSTSWARSKELVQTAQSNIKKTTIITLTLDQPAAGTESVGIHLGGTESFGNGSEAQLGEIDDSQVPVGLTDDYVAYVNGMLITSMGDFTLNWTPGEQSKEIEIVLNNDINISNDIHKQIVFKIISSSELTIGKYMEYIINMEQRT